MGTRTPSSGRYRPLPNSLWGRTHRQLGHCLDWRLCLSLPIARRSPPPRPYAMVRSKGLEVDGRIALVAAVSYSAAIARRPDSAPNLGRGGTCSPALEDRPGRGARVPSLTSREYGDTIPIHHNYRNDGWEKQGHTLFLPHLKPRPGRAPMSGREYGDYTPTAISLAARRRPASARRETTLGHPCHVREYGDRICCHPEF